MNDHDAVDIGKHVRTYMIVFGTLMILTVVTVAVYSLDLSVPVAIGLALFIATVKATLVACYFMHLISEKKMIYWVLLLTVAFFTALILLPLLTIGDVPGS